jgi:hypothetical protein
MDAIDPILEVAASAATLVAQQERASATEARTQVTAWDF